MKSIIVKTLTKLSLLLLTVSVILISCEKDGDGSPDMSAGAMSSGTIAPNSAAGGEVITLTGSGIGQIRSIVFDKNNFLYMSVGERGDQSNAQNKNNHLTVA